MSSSPSSSRLAMWPRAPALSAQTKTTYRFRSSYDRYAAVDWLTGVPSPGSFCRNPATSASASRGVSLRKSLSFGGRDTFGTRSLETSATVRCAAGAAGACAGSPACTDAARRMIIHIADCGMRIADWAIRHQLPT